MLWLGDVKETGDWIHKVKKSKRGVGKLKSNLAPGRESGRIGGTKVDTNGNGEKAGVKPEKGGLGGRLRVERQRQSAVNYHWYLGPKMS